jgi:hypothetical protein
VNQIEPIDPVSVGTLADMSSVESALMTAVRWLLPSAALAIPLLVLPSGDLLATTIIHLTALVILLYGMAVRLLPFIDVLWFEGVRSRAWQAFGTAAALTALVTGFVALVTLATSAGLRLDPSLQFLQLISALDIAWVVTATMIGVTWLAGRVPGRLTSAAVGVMCVVAQWRYLADVGFTSEGGWLLRAADLNRLVLPFDTMAAIVALGSVILAIRRGHVPEVTEHPRPQS